MADWKDILSDDDELLTSEELLKYLDNSLSVEEKSLIEKKINSNEFNADAVRGLLQLKDKDNLPKKVKQLNQKLYLLTTKRQRKVKSKIKILEWVILVILFLLFVCVTGYIIINIHNKNNTTSSTYPNTPTPRLFKNFS